MRTRKLWMSLVFVMLAALVIAPVGYACTIIGAGNQAMADGSTVVTHNDDSSIADYRLWIIPEADWGPDAERDLIVDSHNYTGGIKVGTIPQVEHTYRYFRSRYSFINEKGVAMGESTFSYTRSTEKEIAIYNTLVRNSEGVIDCWYAQDIALERASTAREAVEIMGALVEKYGWDGSGETMNITDGKEVWIAEFYGQDLWAAVRIPNDHVFVAANRARIGEINLQDTANFMASPNIFSFAIEQGWYDPASNKPFYLYENYGPCVANGCYLREWAAYNVLAPSLGIKDDATDANGNMYRYPFSVKPDNKLTVADIFDLKGNYYQNTPYTRQTETLAAGPFGDIYYTGGYRAINVPQTCYLMIAQIKSWLPEEIRSLVWYGYGAPQTSYLTPLWPSMEKLPVFYQKGTRYETFQRDAGWWVSTFVQEMTRLNFKSAIVDLNAVRQPHMNSLYTIVPEIQNAAARLYITNKQSAIDLLSQFAYKTAVSAFEMWTELGDFLLGKYALGYSAGNTANYPTWYRDLVGYTAGPKTAPTL